MTSTPARELLMQKTREQIALIQENGIKKDNVSLAKFLKLSAVLCALSKESPQSNPRTEARLSYDLLKAIYEKVSPLSRRRLIAPLAESACLSAPQSDIFMHIDSHAKATGLAKGEVRKLVCQGMLEAPSPSNAINVAAAHVREQGSRDKKRKAVAAMASVFITTSQSAYLKDFLLTCFSTSRASRDSSYRIQWSTDRLCRWIGS